MMMWGYWSKEIVFFFQEISNRNRHSTTRRNGWEVGDITQNLLQLGRSQVSYDFTL